MGGAERLTTLAAVKDWLDITTDDSDAGLQRVIDAASRFVLNWLGRPSLMRATYTQQFMGNGKAAVLLHNWPVMSITSVGIGSASIPAGTFSAAGQSSGYYLSEDRPGYRTLEVVGYSFYRGSGAQVVYVSGFEATESDIIPDGEPYTLTPTTGGAWSIDRTVYIDGVLATEVPEAPGVGEYSVIDGTYTFAAADVGKVASMTYGYIPYDIFQATTEIVGEWYKRKDRIGILSKSLQAGVGESITFNNQAMTTGVATSLQPYRNVVPL